MINIGYGVYIQKSQIASLYGDGKNIVVSLSSGEKFVVAKECTERLFELLEIPLL